MSAVEIGIAMKTGDASNEEVSQYERKLVQVRRRHLLSNIATAFYCGLT